MNRFFIVSYCIAALAISASLAFASSFPGGSGTSVSHPGTRLPNIIWIMMDDIGREQYPQLGSPYADDGSASFNLTSGVGGNFYPSPVAGDFPNLNTLMGNGITFSGMWSASFCRTSREMLSDGVRAGTSDVAGTAPKALIQSLTNNQYVITHYGKFAFGRAGAGNQFEAWTGFGQNGGIGGGPFAWTTVSPQPVTDATMFHDPVSGLQVMAVEEYGVKNSMNHIEGFYNNAPPSEAGWFGNQTGKPFFMVLSTFSGHDQGGTHCFNAPKSADGYLVPTADLQAAWAAPSAIYGPTPTFSDGPTPPATSPTWSSIWNSPEPNEHFKIWFDCQVSQMVWVDEQIGKILSWLGPDALENTIIFLTGDNGSVTQQFVNRTKLVPPLSGNSADQPTDTLITAAAIPGIGTYGKQSASETGLNVAFVAAYGSVQKALRGTTSEARLQFTDAAETIVQLVVPGGDHFPAGDDFTPLLHGTAASQHGLFGSRVSEAVNGNSASVVLDPPTPGGPIYRLLRISGQCDYVQDLNAVTGTTGATDAKQNIRASGLAPVLTAILQMQSLLLSDHPTIVEAAGC